MTTASSSAHCAAQATCAPAADAEEVPLGWADRAGPRRYPLADYIRGRLAGHFDLLIAEEVQDFGARGSAQGLAASTLAAACGRTLTLTGTRFGG
jgi:hypothetical protein